MVVCCFIILSPLFDTLQDFNVLEVKIAIEIGVHLQREFSFRASFVIEQLRGAMAVHFHRDPSPVRGNGHRVPLPRPEPFLHVLGRRPGDPGTAVGFVKAASVALGVDLGLEASDAAEAFLFYAEVKAAVTGDGFVF